MTDATLVVLSNLITLLLGGGAVTAWFKLGPERRKQAADTQSQILKDLNEAYVRVCDELAQVQMKLALCETESEHLRHRLQKMEGLYQVSMLIRARAHLATKMLGNYELHVDYLLEEMRHHNVAHHHVDVEKALPITPLMGTNKLRTAYQTQRERLDAMEVTELEILLKSAEGPPAE